MRWRVHADGWPDGIDLGAPAVHVAEGHPWAGAPGVVVLPDQQAVREVALAAVVAVGRPVVDRAGSLAKVGPRALWAEVGDRLGLAVAFDHAVPVTEAAAAELRAVATSPAAPWRATPALVVGPTAAGPAYLGQKGGCCLAYQCAAARDGACAPGSWEELLRTHFPDRLAHCSSCSLLDGDDCRGRQRLWIEHHRRERAGR